jgi:phosphatidylserine decarboxylase
MHAIAAVLVPIHRDGWRFIAAFAIASLVLGAIFEPLGWIGGLLTAWCVYFFRDPPRVTPARPGLIVAPADGLVQAIRPAAPPAELGMGSAPLPRISTFLNVFDVHVNRVPADGAITALDYRRGRFFNASLDKASEFNERQSIRLQLPDGREIAFVQIAGLVARRIRCDLKVGQSVRAGEHFGLIRFGSRLDLYLPAGASPLVAVGQRMIAGETVIADIASNEPARAGEMR